MNPNGTNSSNTTPPDHACTSVNEHDSAVRLSHEVYLAASLVITLFGLVGNGLSVTVFSSDRMRKVSSNVYLLSLAVSDGLYLIGVFFAKTLTTLRCWYFVTAAIDLVNRSSLACVLLQYLTDFFDDFSTCIILAFTVERWIAVYLPIRFKQVCTVLRARLTCAAIFVVIGVFIAPYHVMYVGRLEEYNVCAVFRKYEETLTIFYAVESFLFRILPISIVAILNVFIIFRVTKIKRKKRKMMRTKGGGGGDGQHHPGGGGGGGHHHHHEESSLQLTVMLIVVSTTYIVLDIPVLVHFVLQKLTLSKVIDISRRTIAVTLNYTRVLYIAGHSVNFFLYTVSGHVFRQQLVKVLTRCCRAGVATPTRTGAEIPAA